MMQRKWPIGLEAEASHSSKHVQGGKGDIGENAVARSLLGLVEADLHLGHPLGSGEQNIDSEKDLIPLADMVFGEDARLKIYEDLRLNVYYHPSNHGLNVICELWW